MTYRLLIDECLSPELVEVAIGAGYAESSCARDRGLLRAKDWELMAYVVSGDFTLVTHNSRDFRGAGAQRPGGLHAVEPIHAGLVCLNSAYAMDLDRQHDLFRIALKHLADMPDLVNQALEVSGADDGSVEVAIYEIPKAS